MDRNEYDKWKSCTGKKPYTEEAARYKAARRRANKRAGDKKIKCYKCRYCDYWHIGHNRRKDERNIEA